MNWGCIYIAPPKGSAPMGTVQMYFSLQEAWPIIIIVIILFGAKKLPELAHAVGESLKEFKKATNELVGDEKPSVSDSSDNKKA